MRTFSQTYGRTKCNVTIRLHIILIRAIHIQTRKNAFDRNRMSNKKNDQIGLCVCVCSGVSYCFFLSIFMSLWYGKTFSFDSIVDFDFLHHPTETRIQFSNSMALGCAQSIIPISHSLSLVFSLSLVLSLSVSATIVHWVVYAAAFFQHAFSTLSLA